MRERLFALAAAAMIVCVGLPAESGTLTDYRLLVLDGQKVKWGPPVLGTAAVVTYAVVNDDRRFPEARNCRGLAPIDGILSANRIDRSLFEAELAKAFRAWKSVVGVTFLETDPESAGILIGAQTEPRGRAFTNVKYNAERPGQGVRTISKALICLNPEESWKVGFDGNLDAYDLRYTFMHEIGHAIGLDHPAIFGQLMAFKYGERFRAPQAGDVSGGLALYGPPQTQSAMTLKPPLMTTIQTPIGEQGDGAIE